MSMHRRILSGQGSGHQFIRFLLVGLINTGVGYLLFALFVLVGLSSQMALGFAFVLGVIWNFWTHARLVFGRAGLSRLPAYAASYVAIWGFNALALALAERAAIPPLWAQAFLAPVAAVLSFFLIARVLTGRFPIFGARPG
jgi:putative flippase GtrA